MFGHPAPIRALPPTLGRVAVTARTLAFWLAVALPFAYLPLVVAAPAVDPALLVWVLTGNLVALAVGHGHEP